MKRSDFVQQAALGAASSALSPLTATAATAVANTQEQTAATNERAGLVFTRRLAAATADRRAFATSIDNGDDNRYASLGHIGSFTKGLLHAADGTVEPAAYAAYLQSLQSRSVAPLRQAAIAPRLTLLLGHTFDDTASVAGCDGRGLRVAPAPLLASKQTAAELVELYWQALTRDVPFSMYESDATIAQASAELARLPALNAPGPLTPATVFRGFGGALTGPHLSQFVWHDIPCDMFGPLVQVHDLPVAGHDFLTGHAAWMAVQNAAPPREELRRDGRKRYLATGRDLADLVLRSSPSNVWRSVLSIVDALGRDAVTPAFDVDDVIRLTGLAADVTQTGIFHHKFVVHRRARPEEIGGLLQRDRSGNPLHDDLRRSVALDTALAKNGTLLLPQAYIRGCPLHPSYPAGHATAAGVGATILKAFVNAAYVLPKPVVASADGSRLEPYSGAALTLGGEIDKFAANYAYGRATAGVHYRSDNLAGLRYGEAAAISILRNHTILAGSASPGFRFTSFDGEPLVIA